ncbi:MAG: peptidylprolyl isomerase [Nitrospirota bacterium]|nr:peptidylprolyl isomerase [Nitrospirota bacterium]
MRLFSRLTTIHPIWLTWPIRQTNILLSCGLVASLLLIALSGCAEPSEESRIVATVNGKPISQSEFDYRWSELSDAARSRYDRQGGKKKFLDDLISREVLLQEARRQGLDQSLVLRERMERVKEQLILDELMKDAASQPVHISDAELEAYYQSHDDMLLAARQIRGAQIVMANVFQAKDLKHQIGQGWNFSKLAQRYSLDEKTKADGGEFNFSRKGVLDPAIEQFLLTQKAGAVSDPVETAAGFHLIKVVSRDSDEAKHIEAVRQQLKRELYAEKRRKQVEEVLAKLRSSATIRLAAGSELLIKDVGSLAGRTP